MMMGGFFGLKMKNARTYLLFFVFVSIGITVYLGLVIVCHRCGPIRYYSVSRNHCFYSAEFPRNGSRTSWRCCQRPTPWMKF